MGLTDAQTSRAIASWRRLGKEQRLEVIRSLARFGRRRCGQWRLDSGLSARDITSIAWLLHDEGALPADDVLWLHAALCGEVGRKGFSRAIQDLYDRCQPAVVMEVMLATKGYWDEWRFAGDKVDETPKSPRQPTPFDEVLEAARRANRTVNRNQTVALDSEDDALAMLWGGHELDRLRLTGRASWREEQLLSARAAKRPWQESIETAVAPSRTFRSLSWQMDPEGGAPMISWSMVARSTSRTLVAEEKTTFTTPSTV